MKSSKIRIYRRRDAAATLREARAARAGCLAVLRHLFPGVPFSLSITLCGAEEIRAANAETRSIDAVTDVLAYPMLDIAPGENPAEIACAADMERGRIYLGDMLICTSRAREQAAEYGHSTRREFAFLAAHSVLHFLGYDHMEEDERREMETLQRQALTAAGLTRDA